MEYLLQLYLSLEDDIPSKILQFLAHLLKLYDMIELKWKGDDKRSEETILCNSAKVIEKNKTVEKDKLCTTPFLLKLSDTPPVIYAGLCTVARQLVITAAKVYPMMNCMSLLGYKETCLKSHAEASRWTRFCEIDLLKEIKLFKSICNEMLTTFECPTAILQLEAELLTPKKIPNANKYFGAGKEKWARELKRKAFNGIHYSNVDKPSLKRKRDLDSPAATAAHAGTSSSDNDILQEKDVGQKGTVAANGLSPYLCDFHLTIADMIVFIQVYFFIDMVQMCGKEYLLRRLPNLMRWFERLQDRSDFSKALMKCLLKKIEFQNQPESNVDICTKIPCGVSRPVSKEGTKQRNRGSYQSVQPKLSALLERLEGKNDLLTFKRNESHQKVVDWSGVPRSVDPAEGDLNPGRAERKRHQMMNILSAAERIAQPGDVIVDFCAGGGHVGIVLAFFLPECQVILVENKEDSIARAKVRIQKLELPNITICQSNIDYFISPFNIGVALHACGLATDLVLDSCLQKRASFVVCPCCYGSIKPMDGITYPRSRQFLSSDICEADYSVLAHGSDMVTWDYTTEKSQLGKQCMNLIDNDRCSYLTENGYDATFSIMEPQDCTPKNHLVVGKPNSMKF